MRQGQFLIEKIVLNEIIEFYFSKDLVDEKLIGEVLFEGLSYKKMKETLLNGKLELTEVA